MFFGMVAGLIRKHRILLGIIFVPVTFIVGFAAGSVTLMLVNRLVFAIGYNTHSVFWLFVIPTGGLVTGKRTLLAVCEKCE